MIIHFPHETARAATPPHINPLQWHQSLGYARQACARIFRDGGTPADALAAFQLKAQGALDWSKAVELIAEAMTAGPNRRAA
jgi:hypothetical protein